MDVGHSYLPTYLLLRQPPTSLFQRFPNQLASTPVLQVGRQTSVHSIVLFLTTIVGSAAQSSGPSLSLLQQIAQQPSLTYLCLTISVNLTPGMNSMTSTSRVHSSGQTLGTMMDLSIPACIVVLFLHGQIDRQVDRWMVSNGKCDKIQGTDTTQTYTCCPPSQLYLGQTNTDRILIGCFLPVVSYIHRHTYIHRHRRTMVSITTGYLKALPPNLLLLLLLLLLPLLLLVLLLRLLLLNYL